MFSTEVREVKAQCWQSPWRVIKRDDQGRPSKYLRLTPERMFQAAMTGSVGLSEPEARRLGVYEEPEPEPEPKDPVEAIVDAVDKMRPRNGS